MASNGPFTGKIDSCGRVVVPKPIRNILDLKHNDVIMFTVSSGTITVDKYSQSCVFCSGRTNLIHYRQQTICKRCMQELTNS